MNSPTPSCSGEDGVLVIKITDEEDVITSKNWASFKIKFLITIKNP